MANIRHIRLIEQGVDTWNKWRGANSGFIPNLSEGDFSHMELFNINLSATILTRAQIKRTHLTGSYLLGADLTEADLTETNLDKAHAMGAKFVRAQLNRTDLSGSDFTYADFRGASLINANLEGANLNKADLTGADLTGANLQNAILVETCLENTILTNCKVYGISAWALKGTPKEQFNLKIIPEGETNLTVDDLQIAQFIYLLLNREKVRNVINTITSRAVLILGRFTPERKAILEAMAHELRKHNLIPIIFDFDRPTFRDFTETIKTLAGLCLFIIADITNPKSAPLELQAIIPDYQLPLVSIIQKGEKPFSMFSDLIGKYNWVLKPLITYTSVENLIAGFKTAIIDRAWQKHQELQKLKTAIIQTQSIEDFVS